MIRFRHKGDFELTTRYLKKIKKGFPAHSLDKYGLEGVAALASATPVDTGLTASSWHYRITKTNRIIRLEFYNTNIQNGWCNIAVILQYGHATRNGGWVEGRDYINPAIQPVFDRITNDAWREVTGQ